MTWIGETLHIAMKDVRQSKWLLGAVLVLSTIAAFGPGPIGHDGGGAPGSVAMFWFAAVAAIVSVIQHDPPGVPNAFWASRPLRVSTTLVAKLLVIALFVITIPLGEELIALGAIGISLTQSRAAALEPLVVVGRVVTTCLLLGALTRDLKTFVVVVLGVGIAFVGWSLRNGAAVSISGWRPPVHTVLVSVWYGALALGLLATYYRRAIVSGRSLAVVALLVGGAEAILLVPDRPPQSASLVLPGKSIAAPAFRLTSVSVFGAKSEALSVTAEISALADSLVAANTPLLMLSPIYLSVATPDGDSARVAGNDELAVSLPHSLAAPTEVHWTLPSETGDSTARRAARKMSTVLQKFEPGARVALESYVASSWLPSQEMSLKIGSIVKLDGSSLRVEAVTISPHLSIRLRARTLKDAGLDPFIGIKSGLLQVILFNPVTMQAVRLQQRSYQAQAHDETELNVGPIAVVSMDYETSAVGLSTTSRISMLPGLEISEWSFTLTLPSGATDARALASDPEWLKNAQLVIVGPGQGEFPLRLSYTVPEGVRR